MSWCTPPRKVNIHPVSQILDRRRLRITATRAHLEVDSCRGPHRSRQITRFCRVHLQDSVFSVVYSKASLSFYRPDTKDPSLLYTTWEERIARHPRYENLHVPAAGMENMRTNRNLTSTRGTRVCMETIKLYSSGRTYYCLVREYNVRQHRQKYPTIRYQLCRKRTESEMIPVNSPHV